MNDQEREAALNDFIQFHHNPIVADLNKQLAAEQQKVKLLEEELNEAVKLLKLEDIDAAIAKIGGK